MADFNDKFVWCHDVLHAWDPYDAKISRNKAERRNEIAQTVLCVRCGTFKTRILSAAGEVVRKWVYKYPDGYLRAGQGRMTPVDRAMIRKHNVDAFKAGRE